MKYTVLLLFICLTLSGCKKSSVHKDELGPLYEIKSEIKTWTMFNSESYWIYRNEKTQAMDSIWHKHGPFFYQELCYNCPVVEYMWFYAGGPILMRYDIEGGKDANSMVSIVLRNGGHPLALIQRSIDDPLNADTAGYQFNYEVIDRLDSMVLNGNLFTDIIHTRTTWDYTYYNPVYTGFDFYWAKGIGLIKITKNLENSDTAWSLIRWKVYQY